MSRDPTNTPPSDSSKDTSIKQLGVDKLAGDVALQICSGQVQTPLSM